MFTVYTKKMLGDIQTPVSIYLKIRDLYPQSALLESSEAIIVILLLHFALWLLFLSERI